MLDLAIGLSFVFAIFAGLVSGANEICSQILSWRGKVLREGIAMLLGEPKGTVEPAALVSRIYKHPLIDTLSQPKSKPSYIPAENFAAALVQELSAGGSLTALRQEFEDRTSHLGKLFGPMLDEANGSIEGFKARVEAQYDAVMDRVGGWYKRRTQVAMAIIALAFAVVLNIDVIHIAERLESDQALRSRLAQVAEEAVNAAKTIQNSPPQSLPPGAVAGLDAKTSELRKEVGTLSGLGIPIGWKALCPLQLLDGQSLPTAVVGWFFAMIAGMLGAPFWFDAISRLVALRGTGKKPEEAAPAVAPTGGAVAKAVSPASALASVAGPLNDFEANRLTPDDVEALQRALHLPAARIDGVLSDEMRTALREWQRINRRPPSGQFDEPTVMALLYS